MEYALTLTDFGQGKTPVVLPVSRCMPQNMSVPRCITGHCSGPTQHSVAAQHNMETEIQPYSAFEILQNCFHEDIEGVLNNYLQMEKAEIQRAGILPNAQRMRLRAWHYYKTLSKLQQPTEATVVDFIIKGQVEGVDGNNRIGLQNTAFRMRYIYDLRPCHQSCIGPLIWLNDQWEDDPVFPGYWIDTNEYLLPILRAEDYERVAHDMLDRYFPENRKAIGGDTSVVEAEELAHRMGQRIEDVRFADKTIMGQIYYDYGEIDLIDDEGTVYRKRIRPGTILISKDNCSSAAVRNSTIVHECCHMYLDRWFFLLQMMAGRPYQAYSSRRKEYRLYRGNSTVLGWMELQCEKLPAYLLIERDGAIDYIEWSLKRCDWKMKPENIRGIIEGLAKKNNVSFQMAKYRMIELGYYEAEGIKNYVNGIVVPDHGCTWHWPEKTTYTISVEDAVRLEQNDKHFETLLRSGRYRYVEGHFCLNDMRYLSFKKNGKPFLSEYARRHVEECCIGFEVNGRYRRTEYRPAQATRSKVTPVENQYRGLYKLTAEPGTKEYEKENQEMMEDGMLWLDFQMTRYTSFSGIVREIMRRKGITLEHLAFELGVDRRAVSKYLCQEQPSVSHVVGICVALKIPYFISLDVLETAGIRLRATEQDYIYRQFLMNAENLTVSRCEDVLKKYNKPPLFRGNQK